MNDLKGIIEDCNKSDLVSDKIIKKIIEIIGQEEWQDLHDENNDICTTMGELIITLKGIADLEKENERLTVSYETLKLHDEEEIGMLKSENAELKKKNLDTQDAVTMQMYTNKANKEIADRQLTKAKEIIKELLLRLNRLTYTGLNCKECKEAEQFLKDSQQEE